MTGQHQTYRLTDDARGALERAFDAAGVDGAARAADRARFVVGISASVALRRWHRPALASAARQPVAGITLGPVVYLSDHHLLDDWPLVAHECAHVAQVDRRGTWRFLARYGLDYARGRARGLSHHAAYLAIADEVEARRVEASARAHPRPATLLIPVS